MADESLRLIAELLDRRIAMKYYQGRFFHFQFRSSIEAMRKLGDEQAISRMERERSMVLEARGGELTWCEIEFEKVESELRALGITAVD